MTERFDASLIAFHSLSRRLGEPWTAAYLRRVRERASRDPEVRRALATLAGARALNMLVGPYGEGKENRGLLSWLPRGPLVPGDLAPSEADPEENRTWVLDLARRLGAAAAGVAEIREAWIYGRVQLNPYSPEPPVTKAVAVRDVPGPLETEDELVIPAAVNRAVVVLVQMDRKRLGPRPPLSASIETNLGYSRMGALVVSLADAIRAAGYVAIPCMNDTALSVPLAVAAGLGRAGRHGLLIAEDLGSCVRIGKVLTDMPLDPAPAPTAMLSEFCDTCTACARACPAGAIPDGPPTADAPNPCNHPGTPKWPVDGEACLSHWIEQGNTCALCQRVCRF